MVTREGYPVKIYDFEFNDQTYNLLGKVMFPDGDKNGLWTKDGYSTASRHYPMDHDLFMAPIKKEGWVNIYKAEERLSGVTSSVVVYLTKEEAVNHRKKGPCNGYIDTIKIEWEE